MIDLGEYLKEAARHPWKWGKHDCSTWPARWAGIEVVPFDTEEEAVRRIEAAGSLVELWQQHAEGRLLRVDEAEAGDVGVIELPAQGVAQQIGAIFTGKRWAFLTPLGLAAVSTTALAIWRVPCPRP